MSPNTFKMDGHLASSLSLSSPISSPPPPPPPPSLQAYAAVIFWFQIFSAFSGSNPIDSVNLFMYNLIFTSLPIIVVAITDKDLKADVLLREKRFYQQGRCSEVYTHTLFGLAVLDGFYQSAVCFFIAYGVS